MFPEVLKKLRFPDKPSDSPYKTWKDMKYNSEYTYSDPTVKAPDKVAVLAAADYFRGPSAPVPPPAPTPNKS